MWCGFKDIYFKEYSATFTLCVYLNLLTNTTMLHFFALHYNESENSIKAAVGNFGVYINNFLCSFWKKCHNTHRQLISK